MPDLSPYNINSGRAFIPQCLQDNDFRAKGVLYGNNGGLWWAVVDPTRYALNVWKKTGDDDTAYGRTAGGLGAAAFTNGPMMDRYTKSEIKRMVIKQMLFDGIKWGVILAVVGLLFGGAGAIVGGIIGLVGGGILGYYAGRKRALEKWKPYGVVFGTKHGVSDPGLNYTNYVHLGRNGAGFDTYEVSDGNPAGGFLEIIGGLIPLVRHFTPMSATKGAATYHAEYAKLSQRAGLASWGLVPLNVDPSQVQLPQEWSGHVSLEDLVMLTEEDLVNIDLTSTTGDGSLMTGVLVVVGNPGANYMATAAGILAGIGTRDAVAMDGSDSVMMGAGGEFFFGPPPEVKQLIQIYGFYAG